MSIDDRLLEFELVPGITYKLLKQALYKDMLAILGEDEKVKSRYFDEVKEMIDYQNRLRQELRTKLKEYFGIEND